MLIQLPAIERARMVKRGGIWLMMSSSVALMISKIAQVTSSAAVPPDVRKGSAFPTLRAFFFRGYAPFVGRSPGGSKGQSSRKAIGFPHIGRHSRKRYLGNEFSMAQSSVAAFIVALLLSVPCVTLAQTQAQTPAQPQTQPPRPQTQTQPPAPEQTPAQPVQTPAPAPTQAPANLPQSPATQTQTPGTQPQPPAAGTTLPAQPQQQPATTGAPQGQTQPPAGVQPPPGQNVGVAPNVLPAELPSEPPPVAPNFEAPTRPLPSAERVGVDITNQLSLSLNDAIALALRNNNDIDGSRIDVEIAEYGLRAARGVYDPVLSSEPFFERRTTPTASTIGGAGASGSVTQNNTTATAALDGFSPFFGGSYSLNLSAARTSTNNQNATLNPQFPTAFTFTYTQPLLRGLRFDNNRRQIEIAKKNLTLTDAQFRQRAIDVIAQVEQSYWDLVFSLRNLQVQIDAVKQARTQLESNERLVAKGVLAPIEIVAANTQVTTFEQNVYTAQEQVTRAENTLKTLLLPERSDALWTRPLTPVTPVNLEAPRVPLEQALSAALKNRPELSQLQTSAEINQIDTRYFRELTKPQIDLVGTYSGAGLAGALTAAATTPRGGTNPLLLDRINQLSALAGLDPLVINATATPPPDVLVGGLPKSLENLAAARFPTYHVGVVVSLPLRNRTAEANLGRSLAEGRSIQNQRAQQEQLIEADVRNTLQSLRSAEARLAAAAAARSSAEQQYASEQRQFRAGTTTVFLVLQRQNELLAARGRELQAQTDLNKAIALFQRATGNTLTANNVAVRTDTHALELHAADANAFGSELSPAGAGKDASGHDN
jgi:outer membrane protein